MQKQRVIKMEIPADILIALNESETEFMQDMKFFTAVRFYQLKKLTLGKAAQLSGLSRYEFEQKLAGYGIPISNLDIEDIEEDIESLKTV